MQDVFAYCEQLVRETDRDRYLSALFAPQDRRQGLFALYAFDSEIARVRETSREPMPGEIRLQWWREAIEGERDGEAAANPVAAALLVTIALHDLPRDVLLDLLEARSFDLYDDPMPSLAALEAYSDKTRGAIFGLAGIVAGEGLPPELALAAGLVVTIADTVLNLPRNAARGQVFLPLDAMERCGVDADDLQAGKSSAGLRQIVSEIAAHADMRWHRSKGLIANTGFSALLSVVVARATLQRAVRNNDPLRPIALSALRRQWLLWRAARNPRRIF